mmetsp:Transcript_22244/g.66855  ORF Transcript_22244/g.66855 Transcript_22244/m.66855 type:complete len:108 (+) Transcript_22244:606-929(+)
MAYTVLLQHTHFSVTGARHPVDLRGCAGLPPDDESGVAGSPVESGVDGVPVVDRVSHIDARFAADIGEFVFTTAGESVEDSDSDSEAPLGGDPTSDSSFWLFRMERR